MSACRIAIGREGSYVRRGMSAKGSLLAASLLWSCMYARPGEAPAASTSSLNCPLPLISWSSSREGFDPHQTAQVASDLEEAAAAEREAYAGGDSTQWAKVTARLLSTPSYREFRISLEATAEAMKLRDLECRLLLGMPEGRAQTEQAYAEILGSVQKLRRELARSNVPPQVHGYDPPSALVH